MRCGDPVCAHFINKGPIDATVIRCDTMRRTDTCGALRASDIGRKVCLEGWVRFSRDHGQLRFIDLADRYGITQIVFDPEDVNAGDA